MSTHTTPKHLYVNRTSVWFVDCYIDERYTLAGRLTGPTSEGARGNPPAMPGTAAKR